MLRFDILHKLQFLSPHFKHTSVSSFPIWLQSKSEQRCVITLRFGNSLGSWVLCYSPQLCLLTLIPYAAPGMDSFNWLGEPLMVNGLLAWGLLSDSVQIPNQPLPGVLGRVNLCLSVLWNPVKVPFWGSLRRLGVRKLFHLFHECWGPEENHCGSSVHSHPAKGLWMFVKAGKLPACRGRNVCTHFGPKYFTDRQPVLYHINKMAVLNTNYSGFYLYLASTFPTRVL